MLDVSGHSTPGHGCVMSVHCLGVETGCAFMEVGRENSMLATASVMTGL